MFKKNEFLEEVIKLEIATRPSTPSEREKWSAQYDLYASGYRGPELHPSTIMLCESEVLCTPVESIVDIISRHEKTKKNQGELDDLFK